MIKLRWRVTWNSAGMVICPTLAAAQRLMRTLARKGKTDIELIAW